MTKPKSQAVDKSIHISNCHFDGRDADRMDALKALSEAARQNGIAIAALAAALDGPRDAMIKIEQSKD